MPHCGLPAIFERSMQLVGGKVLMADKSYKAVKCVFTATSVDGKSRGQGGTQSYDSVYTVMNEHNQIVSIHFVRSGDMKEVQVILERVQRWYKLHGFEQIELFYTDNCCQEYKMITHAFPSLAKNDAQTSNTRKELERLKLPASFKTRAINNYGIFVPIGVQILERLEKCMTGCHILVGFDAEWDALTTEDKRDPHPATLQLDLVDGSIVVVLHILHMFSHIK
jgi:hypothetical protein